jgi:hypothetical protein
MADWKGKYITWKNDSKGFILYGVLQEKTGAALSIQKIGAKSKFPCNKNQVEEYWLQKQSRLLFEAQEYEVTKIILVEDDGYYVELENDYGEERQVELKLIIQHSDLIK